MFASGPKRFTQEQSWRHKAVKETSNGGLKTLMRGPLKMCSMSLQRIR